MSRKRIRINIAPGKQTVAQFLHDWLTAVKSDVAPSTFVSYKSMVRLHLIPFLGSRRLSDLSAMHVQQLKDELLQCVVTSGPGVALFVEGSPVPDPRHLSSSTVRYCLKVLRMALDHACKLDLVPRNVALLVDFPKVEHAEIEPFTPEQAMKFVEACKGHRLGALFSVATAIGLRKGESLALKWSTIDFERGTLAVRLAPQNAGRRERAPAVERAQALQQAHHQPSPRVRLRPA